MRLRLWIGRREQSTPSTDLDSEHTKTELGEAKWESSILHRLSITVTISRPRRTKRKVFVNHISYAANKIIRTKHAYKKISKGKIISIYEDTKAPNSLETWIKTYQDG